MITSLLIPPPTNLPRAADNAAATAPHPAAHPQVPGIAIELSWRVLEVGNWPNKLFADSTTLNINPSGRPGVVHDLSVVSYPLAFDSFDLIVCLHVLEHHVHAFASRPFDYYVEGTAVSGFNGSHARLVKKRVEIVGPGSSLVSRFVRNWINAHQRTYEKNLTLTFPRHTMQYMLRAVKGGFEVNR